MYCFFLFYKASGAQFVQPWATEIVYTEVPQNWKSAKVLLQKMLMELQ